MTEPDYPCRRFVAAVTDYLDGAVEPDERAAIDAHLDECPGCQAALAQFRTTIELSGQLRHDDVAALDPSLYEMLRAAFRSG